MAASDEGRGRDRQRAPRRTLCRRSCVRRTSRRICSQRTQLVEKLREGRDSTLTLVCAPAGYGKTTLLAQWATTDTGRTAFAWVTLDAMDADPARLWGHVITALQQVYDRAGERSLLAFSAGQRSITEDGDSAPHR